MNALPKLEETLMRIIQGEQGIDSVILVDPAGLIISYVSKTLSYPVNIDGIGAIASAVFGASEEQGKYLSIGGLALLINEFDKGKIFAAKCNNAVLCVITKPEINIGMIRYLIMEALEELSQLLNAFTPKRNTGVAEKQDEEEALASLFKESQSPY